MTPLQISGAAREKYNAVGDTNWSDTELMTLIYAACMEILTDVNAPAIEDTFSMSTVIGTQAYIFPTLATSIERLTYNGKKLFPITQREDDSLTIQNDTITDSGQPSYYYEVDGYVYLRPIPDAVGTLKFWFEKEPSVITTTSTMEVPSFTHTKIIDFVVSEMAAKDLNFNMATYYRELWKEHKKNITSVFRMNRRGDSFAVVQVEEILPHGYMEKS